MLLLTRPGLALMSGRTRMLWQPLRAPSSGGGSSGGSLSAISGLAGWWDASTPAGQLNATGSPVSGWRYPVAAVFDRTTTAPVPLPVFFGAGSGTAPWSLGGLNGVLGGIGRSPIDPSTSIGSLTSGGYTDTISYQATFALPQLDADQGFRHPSIALQSSADWTVLLVWSRPNYRAGSTADINLVTAGTTPVVTMGSTASATNLSVFGTVVAAVERRHTHSLVLSYSHTANQVSAYLDGATTPVVANAALGSGGLLTLLHSGSAGGGAQCYFHEAAYWPSALAGGAITAALAYLARWYRGARKGISLAVVGQSNSVNGYAAGAYHLLAQGIAQYLGALSYRVVASSGVTLIGGVGLYPAPIYNLAGTFLTNPGDGSSPSTWALDTASGAIGIGCETYFQGLPPVEQADVAAIWWPWNETDSCRLYSEKATLLAAEQRAIGFVRAFLGKTAASLPWLTWNAMPFPYGTNDGGMQSIREIEYDLTQTSGENARIIVPQTSACSANGADNSHIDDASHLLFARLGAASAAAAILASGSGDPSGPGLAGCPVNSGPSISHVKQETSTSYLITVVHDIGTDLIVPAGAANGNGFAIMDGGSGPAAPGAILNAVACTRVDATHIRITLATAPANGAASLKLYYPYGNLPATSGAWGGTASNRIGTGNAVTDNAQSVMAASATSISSILGSGWALNFPLAATTYGAAVSTT